MKMKGYDLTYWRMNGKAYRYTRRWGCLQSQVDRGSGGHQEDSHRERHVHKRRADKGRGHDMPHEDHPHTQAGSYTHNHLRCYGKSRQVHTPRYSNTRQHLHTMKSNKKIKIMVFSAIYIDSYL